VDISFDESDFPPLQNTTSVSSQTSTATLSTATNSPPAAAHNSTMQSNAPGTPINSAPPVFNYQAELDRISIEIETKLKKQFDKMFTQLENKLDNFML